MTPGHPARHGGVATALGALLAASFACIGTVEGERAATGACPEGEECSLQASDGLHFVGEVFYDSAGVALLGPILAGGRFDLGVRSVDGRPLERWTYTFADPDVLDGELGTGEFLGDGVPVDGYLALRAGKPGRAYVRIVEPRSGALIDRVALDVYVFDRAVLVNAHDPDRGYTYAGCTEALGVHLIGRDANGNEARLFDQDLDVTGDMITAPDPGMWDCFLVDVPGDVTTVQLDAHTAELTVPLEMPVRALEDDGLSVCP